MKQTNMYLVLHIKQSKMQVLLQMRELVSHAVQGRFSTDETNSIKFAMRTVFGEIKKIKTHGHYG